MSKGRVACPFCKTHVDDNVFQNHLTKVQIENLFYTRELNRELAWAGHGLQIYDYLAHLSALWKKRFYRMEAILSLYVWCTSPILEKELELLQERIFVQLNSVHSCNQEIVEICSHVLLPEDQLKMDDLAFNPFDQSSLDLWASSASAHYNPACIVLWILWTIQSVLKDRARTPHFFTRFETRVGFLRCQFSQQALFRMIKRERKQRFQIQNLMTTWTETAKQWDQASAQNVLNLVQNPNWQEMVPDQCKRLIRCLQRHSKYSGFVWA